MANNMVNNNLNLNKLEGLLNKLKRTTEKISKKKKVTTKKRGRPSSRVKLITSKYKNRKCTKCTNCGCNCNKKKKSKVVLIKKNPKNSNISTRVVSFSNHNNRMNIPNKNTRRNIRSIINKLVSRKNHTKSHNLATLIQNMSNTSQNNNNTNQQLNEMNKTRTIKSYYTTVSNGSKKLERGRRIEDNSSNPYIKIHMLNNGQIKQFQVPRQ